MKLNKTQIFVLAFIAILTTVLYFLPKKVLSNKNEGANRDKPSENASSHDPSLENLKPLATILQESIAGLSKDDRKKLEIGKDSNENAIQHVLSYYKKYDNKLGMAICMEKLQDKQSVRVLGMAYYAAFKQSEIEENRKAIALKAISFLDPIANKNADDIEVKAAWADCYINTSQTPMNGIMALKEIVASDSTNENALFLLGQFAIKSGQLDKAIPRFQTLVRHYPSIIKYSLYLAQLFSAQGDHAQALQTLTDAKKYAVRKTAKDSIDQSIQHLN